MFLQQRFCFFFCFFWRTKKIDGARVEMAGNKKINNDEICQLASILTRFLENSLSHWILNDNLPQKNIHNGSGLVNSKKKTA